MSFKSRNLKVPFVSSSRAIATDEFIAKRLINRFTNGLMSNMYYDNDYEAFEMIKNYHSNSTLKAKQKLKQIKQFKRRGTETSNLKIHQKAWTQFNSKLSSQIQRLEMELHKLLESHVIAAHGVHTDGCCNHSSPFAELLQEKTTCDMEFSKWKAWILGIVTETRNEAELFLYDHRGGTDRAEEINSAFVALEDLLESVYIEVTSEIGHLDLDCSKSLPKDDHKLQYDWEGISPDIMMLDSPDDSLWMALMKESVMLDELFKSRLRELQNEFSDVLRLPSTGTWDSDDHILFEMIVEQYPRHEFNNSRALVKDMLHRIFPRLTNDEFSAHLEWYDANKVFHLRRISLLNTWQREKEELEVKTKAAFIEAEEEFERHKIELSERKRQKSLCNSLIIKVEEWRKAKREIENLEAQLQQVYLKKVAERDQLVRHREREMRSIQKQQIHEYKKEKDLQLQREEEMKLKILNSLKEKMAVQAETDKKRVEYRHNLQKEKVNVLKEKKHLKEIEEEEKEKALEKLREKVRVEVDADPLRLQSNTVSSFARKGIGVNPNEAYEPSQNIFKINTFKDSTITNDPRVKLEMALRDASLHDTDYGRMIISKATPPQLPRKDMHSHIVFKDT